MNYLQLCQAVARRAGVSGSHTPKPLTVTGQSGKLALVCDYVAEACREVETEWDDFTFMRVEADFAWPADTQFIDPADTYDDIERFSQVAFTARDETVRRQLTFMGWENYRVSRVIDIETTDDLPSFITIDRAGRIHTSPVSTKAFVLRGEAVLRPKTLVDDADEPNLPADYRDAIVHRALVMYYMGDGAFNEAEASAKDYERWLERIEDRFLPYNSHGRTQSNEQPMVIITE